MEEECQKNFGAETRGMATEVLPFPEEPAIGGSTDVADVGWNAPTMGCTMPTWPQGISAHTWPVVPCGGTSIGLKGALSAARMLAATGVEVMTDEDRREAARADFERRTQGRPYVSPPSLEREHLSGLPQ